MAEFDYKQRPFAKPITNLGYDIAVGKRCPSCWRPLDGSNNSLSSFPCSDCGLSDHLVTFEPLLKMEAPGPWPDPPPSRAECGGPNCFWNVLESQNQWREHYPPCQFAPGTRPMLPDTGTVYEVWPAAAPGPALAHSAFLAAPRACSCGKCNPPEVTDAGYYPELL